MLTRVRTKDRQTEFITPPSNPFEPVSLEAHKNFRGVRENLFMKAPEGEYRPSKKSLLHLLILLSETILQGEVQATYVSKYVF